jgi:hypothetical protein
MFGSVLVHSEPKGFKKGIKHTGKKRAACMCAVALLSLQHRRKE